MTDTTQLYVLCDTNVAVRDTHLFGKKGGPQLVAMLRATQTKLLVPEVLAMEYVSQFSKVGDENINKAERELDKLESMTGYRLKPVLPAPRFGEAQAQKLLSRLEDVIHPIPLTDELKLAACNRSMNDTRPTSKSDHGLKDCMIWESLLTLPAGSEVLLTSRDAIAFLDGEVLASELEKEAAAKGIKVTAIPPGKDLSLNPLVNALRVRFVHVDDLAVDTVPIVEHPLLKPVPASEPVVPIVTNGGVENVPNEGTDDHGELEAELIAALYPLLSADLMSLGFVTAMKSLAKSHAVNMLERSGVPANAARNALERLALAGLIKDTGNHYLAKDQPLAKRASVAVEDELIKLYEQGE